MFAMDVAETIQYLAKGGKVSDPLGRGTDSETTVTLQIDRLAKMEAAEGNTAAIMSETLRTQLDLVTQVSAILAGTPSDAASINALLEQAAANGIHTELVKQLRARIIIPS